MTQIAMEETEAKVAGLIRQALAGEEVIITRNNQPVARIVSIPQEEPRPHARRGSAKGLVLYMADDFDAPLDDFKEYME